MEQGINSVVASDFKYGEKLSMGHFCVIEEGVLVGNNVTIGNHTILHKGIQIGDDSVVGSFCEIGKNVKIGRNVVVQGRIRTGDDCTIEDDVTIKYGTILTGNVLLKRKCFLGPNVITLGSTHKRVELHGTVVGERTYIGAGSKLAGAVKVGDDIVVGAMSFVNRDIYESGIYVGIPVKKIKDI
jgi:UDP-3-O-[3-hydroxymyristoyl] glucosamine N-acyltransferase